MKFSDLLQNLGPTGRSFNTLGGRSRFKACNRNGELVITNSSGNDSRISRKFYDTTWNRYNELDTNQRKVSQNYTDTGWDECPGRIQAPYLPAIWETI